MSDAAGRGRGRGTGMAAPPGAPPGGRGTGVAAPPGAAPVGTPPPAAGRGVPPGGRGGGVAAPPQQAPPPQINTPPAIAPRNLPPPPPAAASSPAPAGRGGGVKLPAFDEMPAGLLSPRETEEGSGPLKNSKTPRAFIPQVSRLDNPNQARARMPKSKKYVVPPTDLGGAGSKDLKAMGSMSEVGAQDAKVKREHIPRYDKKKWSIQSTFYEYEKIRDAVVCEGLFSRHKPKSWAVIFYDLILFYLPGPEGPPETEDKNNGCPHDYFFLDNIIDSTKIKADAPKMTITLPTKVAKENLELKCDSKEQFDSWAQTLQALAEVFETTSREGMESREVVEKHVKDIQLAIPLVFEPHGFADGVVPASRAIAWLDEMKGFFQKHKEHAPYLSRIERFSAFRFGNISVYTSFYFARDRDGPIEILENTKKKVFEYWEKEVERIITLVTEVLSEEGVDKDHQPFHMEDCQIAAFLIECMNSYSAYVHGVKPKALVLTEQLATLDDLYGRLSVAPLLVEQE